MPGRNGSVVLAGGGLCDGLSKQRYNNINPKWRHEHWLSKPLRILRNLFHSNRQYGRTQRLGVAILFIGRLFRYFISDLLY